MLDEIFGSEYLISLIAAKKTSTGTGDFLAV
jgi:hypothetical protein